MEILFFMLAFGCITGVIAANKNRNAMGWFVYGALIFIVAIIHVLIIKPLGAAVCPHCKSQIDGQASVCPNCARDTGFKIEEQTAKPNDPRAFS